MCRLDRRRRRPPIVLNVVGVHAADEEKDDMLVRDITAEARAIPFHQKKYDLGGFTNHKTKQQAKLVRHYLQVYQSLYRMVMRQRHRSVFHNQSNHE